MAMWLRQSTAVDLPIGPFLDSTDGNTQETALTLTQPDIRLKKNGGNWAQKNAAQTLTHEEAGWYEVSLDATDTGTLGLLMLAVHETGALPVWHEYLVVPAQVWDSYFSTDLLQVHAAEISNSLITAASIATDAITDTKIAADAITAAKIANGAIDALTFAAGAIDAAAIAADAITAAKIAPAAIDAATFASGAIDAAAIASDAITAAKIAADAIGASELAADAVTEIVAGVFAKVVESEGSYTAQQVMSIAMSVLAGVTSSNGAVLKSPNGVATRVTATIDASNNRTAMTINPSA